MTQDLKMLNSYDSFDYKVVTEVVQPAIVSEDDRGNTVEIPAVKKTTMKGILQKADTLNQNGRIYPLSVLERELRNYQKFISENRALGELDHPECVSGCNIMTYEGWKDIKKISDDELTMIEAKKGVMGSKERLMMRF